MKLRFILKFVGVVIILVLATALGSNSSGYASQMDESQSEQTGYSFDYVLLLDRSRSMSDGNLFSQMQAEVISFVQSLPPGTNVVIYTFNSQIDKVGAWTPLQSGDYSEIGDQVSSLQPSGGTRFWDAFCEGLDELDQLVASDNTEHVQTIISYTDGEDTESAPESKADCLARFQNACLEGRISWDASFLGFDAPDELDDLEAEGCVEVCEGNCPITPIRIVHIRPNTLDLGNIYEDGEATACLVFWPFGNDVVGRSLLYGPPSFINRNPPSGMDMTICPTGEDCEREVQISNNEVCLDFSMVNFREIEADEEGEYQFEFSLRSAAVDDQVLISPDTIVVNFRLIEPPAPTIIPSVTPAPEVVTAVVSCDPDLDLKDVTEYLVNLENGESYHQTMNCIVGWGANPDGARAEFQLGWGDAQDNPVPLVPGEHYWFVQNGAHKDLLILTEANNTFSIEVDIPHEFLIELSGAFCGGGTNSFEIPLVYSGENLVRFEGTPPEKVGFQIIPEDSLFCVIYDWIIPIIIALVVVIVLICITRPRFSKLAVLEVTKNKNRLADLKPVSWWSGAVQIGEGQRSALSLANVDSMVLEISPVWMDSCLTRKVRPEGSGKYKLKPLEGATIELQDSSYITEGQTAEIMQNERIILMTATGYRLYITILHEPPEEDDGMFNDEDEGIYKGF